MTNRAPSGGRGRGAPSGVSFVTPAGRGRGGALGPSGRGRGGQTGKPRRGTAPPGAIGATVGQELRRDAGSEFGTRVPPLRLPHRPPRVSPPRLVACVSLACPLLIPDFRLQVHLRPQLLAPGPPCSPPINVHTLTGASSPGSCISPLFHSTHPVQQEASNPQGLSTRRGLRRPGATAPITCSSLERTGPRAHLPPKAASPVGPRSWW